jgi:hypothetical protein
MSKFARTEDHHASKEGEKGLGRAHGFRLGVEGEGAWPSSQARRESLARGRVAGCRASGRADAVRPAHAASR